MPIAKVFAVGNYDEEMGMLAKSGLVDRDLLLDIDSRNIELAWDALIEFKRLPARA